MPKFIILLSNLLYFFAIIVYTKALKGNCFNKQGKYTNLKGIADTITGT